MMRTRVFCAMLTMSLCAASAHAQFAVVNKVRGQVRRTECINNLKQIGELIAAYRADHNGKMPAKLKDLVNGGSRPLFVCPQDKRPPVRDGFKCSYRYVGPLPSDTPPDTIVVYDRKPFNHGVVGRCCLYYDGHVKALTEADFQKQFRAQQRRREARKKRKKK